ncbi:peptide chain release factor 2 [Weissella koreensis]|uniref:Peptide chain release factor 2 n=1 Tax=Weissella koreensis TaxID=165096 RepID=A0A7H1ML47_9LACO|nr:peptide chain release factor 2 [Weissella koreensis]AVH74979.1 peptide chain release factor 2 [Weissella koreensis]EJF33388.1 peptide chain release factor 2 [Weissella koreensis KCTC 3621]MCZ9310855.1 peptide chain release factor 2 [Weissella koreensis]QGN20205.1 peptide chain release factor 2 [Weissella koreensis]QNT64183.1 peptide chain release factor 2 [Weissella koreensis]
MELVEIRHDLEEIEKEVTNLGENLDLEALNDQIAANEDAMGQADFWNDNVKAQALIDENNDVKQRRDNYLQLRNGIESVETALELLNEMPDDEMEAELDVEFQNLQEKLEQYRLEQLLNEPYDANNAILEIHPGSGGTESADWGANLQRMYTRWAEKHNFKVDILDYHPGDVAGIDSVTLKITGHNAFGYLRSERGVHRFVRISPFDSAGRRHTSFVSVDIMPELDDSIEIDINPADVKMDVYRASGAGGQHINKTSSAVRLTHLPTGVVVASQQQRSQFQNKDTAYGMLKAKLYQLEMDKKEAERAEISGDHLENGWGSQIRSYVFQPYRMVKDHRTNFESGNPQGVMDGNLDGFMNAYLQWKLGLLNPE